MSGVLLQTNIPGCDCERGKARDNFNLDDKYRLIVTTDRISAFDVVLPDGIPNKGEILTRMSAFWFHGIKMRFPLYPTHFVTAEWSEIIRRFPGLKDYADQLAGRSMLVYRAPEIVPVEAIIRGYLYGSVIKEYETKGTVCGLKLPAGLKKASKLEPPIFTPSTKAEQGQHDENISEAEIITRGLASATEVATIKSMALTIYSWARDVAVRKDIILADTKFEFGRFYNSPWLVDEMLTPDSSRFWPANEYEPGRDQASFDKQFLRDYLQGLVDAGQWNKQAPAPKLPLEIIEGTRKRYLQALEMLTGETLEPDPTEISPKSYGPPCGVCGHSMVHKGTCFQCPYCGHTVDCS